MEDKKSVRDKWFDPLYFPLWTVGPVEVWLLFHTPPLSAVEASSYIVGILFLIFSGAVETNSEEWKHQVFGYIYLISALLLSSIGIFRWVW